ncbi:MAG: F0F1 ATP synthase subunit gamma [Nannocystaceae bacterium]
MTSLRQLEDRMHAWQSFRGIARATRTLAAAQSLQWNESAHRAEQHLRRCLELRDAYPSAMPPPDAPYVVLGLGSDLGLCGPFNRTIAERFTAQRPHAARGLVVGARLGALVGRDQNTLTAPTSFPRVQSLATELELLLDDLPPMHTRLVVVLAIAVDPDGRPRVEVLDEPGPRAPASSSARVAELSSVQDTGSIIATTTRHARIVAALTRSAASETEARWRTMNRAFDAADRRIGEQQRELRKQRQEQVTQEMLEARQGGRASPGP